MSAETVRCASCGCEPKAEDREPFTYFEFVPRWSGVRFVDGRLVVSASRELGEEGGDGALRCNECDHFFEEVPPLVFEVSAATSRTSNNQ